MSEGLHDQGLTFTQKPLILSGGYSEVIKDWCTTVVVLMKNTPCKCQVGVAAPILDPWIMSCSVEEVAPSCDPRESSVTKTCGVCKVMYSVLVIRIIFYRSNYSLKWQAQHPRETLWMLFNPWGLLQCLDGVSVVNFATITTNKLRGE